jgi:cation transport regulator ChaB
MPFDPDNPPAKVKGLSKKKQRQFCHVFNSCWKKHHDDGKCHAMAWGAVRKSASDQRKLASRLLRLARVLLTE